MITMTVSSTDGSAFGLDAAASSHDVAVLRADAVIWRAVAVSAGGEVYIWGAGSAGRQAAAAIRRRGGRVAGFVESSGERAGQRLDEVPILSPCDLDARRSTGQTPLVVVASLYASGIIDTLREMEWSAAGISVIDVTALVATPPAADIVATPAAAAGAPAYPTNGLGQVLVRARVLSDVHLRHCRLVPSRELLLPLLPSGAVVAEVGTQHGLFARRILTTTRPVTLHIIDIDMSRFERAEMERARGNAVVHLHEGDSVAVLERCPDGYFDWIYIDGDHSIDGVRRDAAVALRKIKRDGLLVFNDYTPYSPVELSPYGTMPVVHDLCLDEGFEMIYLALHGGGYHDVVLRRRAAN